MKCALCENKKNLYFIEYKAYDPNIGDYVISKTIWCDDCKDAQAILNEKSGWTLRDWTRGKKILPIDYLAERL